MDDKELGKVEKAILDSTHPVARFSAKEVKEKARKLLGIDDTPSSRAMFSRAIGSLQRKGLIKVDRYSRYGGHAQRIQKVVPKQVKSLAEQVEETMNLANKFLRRLEEHMRDPVFGKLTFGLSSVLIIYGLKKALDKLVKKIEKEGKGK